MEDAKAGKIRRVDIQGQTITVTPQSGSEYTITSPGDLWMVEDLRKSGVQVPRKAPEEPSLLTSVFISWFLMLLLDRRVDLLHAPHAGRWRRRRRAFSFGKSKVCMLGEQGQQGPFSGRRGLRRSHEDVQEIADFLRDPMKFQRLGGRIPRGVLPVGSPGTGKTLLAKAIAGESGVPFFTISSLTSSKCSSASVRRVRDMFETAKKNAPCIIFIDEIDAVGQRGAGLGGGNDEREQTLNQMFRRNGRVRHRREHHPIAATNVLDVSTSALLGARRFDCQVVVPLPDIMAASRF